MCVFIGIGGEGGGVGDRRKCEVNSGIVTQMELFLKPYPCLLFLLKQL